MGTTFRGKGAGGADRVDVVVTHFPASSLGRLFSPAHKACVYQGLVFSTRVCPTYVFAGARSAPIHFVVNHPWVDPLFSPTVDEIILCNHPNLVHQIGIS